MTVTRDVVFQSNPSIWLDNSLLDHDAVFSSECLLYQDEPWGRENLLETFGSMIYEQMKTIEIYNVGVIAGKAPIICNLVSLIWQLSTNRSIPIVDQAAFNFLTKTAFYKNALFSRNRDHWAVQLGTSDGAVLAGSGSIGDAVGSGVLTFDDYLKSYQDEQPMIDEATVCNHDGEAFCIVHQYDRLPELKVLIERKYGVEIAPGSQKQLRYLDVKMIEQIGGAQASFTSLEAYDGDLITLATSTQISGN